MRENLRTVLVTGCSSGIGRAVAIKLTEKGYRVLATVRNDADAQSLRELGLPQLHAMLLDVTDDGSVARAVDQVQELSPQGLYALVNNAGAGLPAAVELSTIDEVRHLLEVNTLGPLRMIQSFLPLLRAGGGRIINMSSMNGTLALPMVGAYSASKFALEALSDTLRVELRPWQIPVVIVRPGQVRTSIFAKARKLLNTRIRQIPMELRNGYEVMYQRAGQFNDRGAESSTTSEMVAITVQKALEARWPRTHYLVGYDALGMQLAKLVLIPRLFDRFLARAIGALKPLKKNPPAPQPELPAAKSQIEPKAVS